MQPGETIPDFEEVYEQHFAFVFRTLRALGVPGPGLDDAVQEVFLVVHRRLPEFQGNASVKTWLFSIARYVARNSKRLERRKGRYDPLDPETPNDDARDPEAETDSARIWQFVGDFLDELDEGKRAVFVLCLLEGTTAVEAAEALAIPVNTVYSRIHAVRRAFRQAVAARLEGETP